MPSLASLIPEPPLLTLTTHVWIPRLPPAHTLPEENADSKLLPPQIPTMTHRHGNLPCPLPSTLLTMCRTAKRLHVEWPPWEGQRRWSGWLGGGIGIVISVGIDGVERARARGFGGDGLAGGMTLQHSWCWRGCYCRRRRCAGVDCGRSRWRRWRAPDAAVTRGVDVSLYGNDGGYA